MVAAGEIAGRYSLDREIGRGGMGAVWLGRDAVLGRQVALKRVGAVALAGSPDLARAEREARLAARVNHPHVVAVFDLVEQDGDQWLVMEYVAGSTLAGLVQRHGRLTAEQAAPLLAQAADALAAAHAVGIVHRDVKPSNILVTEQGQVKLSDFGIARAQADASLTQTGLVTGSPAYLAPEVASGAGATGASDVWSLGATLFHALSGHPPYEVGENVMGALYRIVHEQPPRLPDAGWLAPLLEATMCREPGDRWSMARVHEFLVGGAPPPGSRTDTLPRPVRGAGGAAAAPDHTRSLAPIPTGATAEPVPSSDHRRGGSRRPLLVLLALAVVTALTVGAFALGLRGDDEAAPPGQQSPSSPRSTSAEPNEQDMEAFVADYLDTATADPAAAFNRLTPAFQTQSGDLAGYQEFWSGIQEARLLSVRADPGDLTVAYDVSYTTTDGRTWEDSPSLKLVFEDGKYLIAGES
ncbi:serine/threonine-protein kinase [Nocardioides ferulae]|uniref:serine/threonine-protein kinase n=1 Tax=Nocardioides ferulae TaxID=2340821 RepID=UPI0013DE09A4|nr:serine/threonine-protein kinase [Nocardioides ferulae]